MTPTQVIACRMYTDYCKAVGGKAFNGDPLPSWNEFVNDSAKQVQAAGWIAAASGALADLAPKDPTDGLKVMVKSDEPPPVV
jgi:hypothetical protein